MNEKIYNDILELLADSLHRIKEGHYGRLKEISTHTVHNASIFQDKDSITIAVLVYSLSKVLEKCDKRTVESVKNRIEKAMNELKRKDVESYRTTIKSILTEIDVINDKLKGYFKEVVEFSEIKKASALYYHGLSIGRAAEMLGINKWDLMKYIGGTRINDDKIPGKIVYKRLQIARRVFAD